MIVVDASVAVKWFLPEPLSEAAEAVLAGNETRLAPEHIFVEVGQALLRAWRTGGITREHAREAIASLDRFVQSVPTRDFATTAMDIAAESSCTNYDALYVAVAERFDATVLTADRRLMEQLRSTRRSARIRLLGTPNDV